MSVTVRRHLGPARVEEMTTLATVSPECFATAEAESARLWVVLVSVDPARLAGLENKVGEEEVLTSIVGVERCPFSDAFVAAAYQFNHGIPRQLNRVYLNGLLICMSDRKTVLDETDAKRAIIELDRAG